MGRDNFGVQAIFGENRELLNLHKAFLQVLQNNGSYTYAYFELHFEKYYQNEIWSNTSALYDTHF